MRVRQLIAIRSRSAATWVVLLGSLLLLGGCREQPTLQELALAFNERQISHCLFVQGQFPPWGNGYLYAQTGQLDCEALWRLRRLQEVP